MIVTFYIKGSCVDNFFHILVNNGYQVQMSNTTNPNEYRVDLIYNKEEN